MLTLDTAASHLLTACDALHRWNARTGNYVVDGNQAIDSIDHLLRELYRVRCDLIGEIRVDEDERIARVDRLLAAHRARQAGHLDGEVSR